MSNKVNDPDSDETRRGAGSPGFDEQLAPPWDSELLDDAHPLSADADVQGLLQRVVPLDYGGQADGRGCPLVGRGPSDGGNEVRRVEGYRRNETWEQARSWIINVPDDEYAWVEAIARIEWCEEIPSRFGAGVNCVCTRGAIVGRDAGPRSTEDPINAWTLRSLRALFPTANDDNWSCEAGTKRAAFRQAPRL